MAEALGAAASVLTIIDSVGRVTKLVLSCKNATNESRRLVQELSHVRGLLTTLEETTLIHQDNNDEWSSAILDFGADDGVLHQFKQLLDLLELGIGAPSQKKGFKRLKSVLQWPYKENETFKLINAVERYKTLFGLALGDNHIRLSRVIKENMEMLKVELETVRDSVQQHSERLDTLNQTAGAIGEAMQSSTRRLDALHSVSREVRDELQQNSQRLLRLDIEREDSEFTHIFHWLSSWNFRERQRDIMSVRVKDTGDWFLRSKEYTDWLAAKPSTLLCRGPPGVGKSVLASLAIDHLGKSLTTDCRVIGYFCDYTDLSKNRYQDLLGSLLQQLIQRQCSTWQSIKATHAEYRQEGRASVEALLSLLREEVKSYQRVHVVLDAFDEWSTDPKVLSSLLSDLRSIGPRLGVLVTARPLAYIDELFERDATVDIIPPRTDFETYVHSRIANHPRFHALKDDFKLQSMTQDIVVKKCEGLFLLARLQMDELLQRRQKTSYIETLQQLPKTPDALYDTTMARIDDQPTEDADLAKQVLGWVYHAREHLLIDQLQYALAIHVGNTNIDEADCLDWEVLASICSGLVLLSKESRLVRFVHPTIRTYFDNKKGSFVHSFEPRLASACLRFFLSDTFRSPAAQEELLASTLTLAAPAILVTGYTRIEGKYHDRMRLFRRYAARHTVQHYLSSGSKGQHIELMKSLFRDAHALQLFWRARMLHNPKGQWWYIDSISDREKISLAAYMGLGCVVQWLLGFGLSPNPSDPTSQTPLFSAVSQGNISMVKILLHTGADPNVPSVDSTQCISTLSDLTDFRLTPTECAVRHGNIEMAGLLQKYGAKIDNFSSTLYLAVLSKSPEAVKFVLDNSPGKCSETFQDSYSLADLASTSTPESLSCIRFLISELGVNCNIVGGRHCTALMAAAASPGCKSLEVLETLLDAGADLHVSGGLHGTALLAAASPHSYRAVEKLILLFAKGADPNLTGPNGSLIELLREHPDEDVRYLSFGYDEPTRPDNTSKELVRVATSGTLERMIQLIEDGANVNAEIELNGFPTSALFAAMNSESPDKLLKVQCLLTYGADPNSATKGYTNILQRYLDNGRPNTKVLECLIAGSVNVNAMSGSKEKGTALEIAIRRFNQAELAESEMTGKWKKVILLLYELTAPMDDQIFERLFQYPWLLEALTTGS
ncbi:hypothetical protein BDV96DRAFT_37679 [Lophiotrema nucula]|uniref:Uncharacterized protein n=1 Tax=Lophiotrema nucula TaxID=690887 RepID=A0A6A5ZEW0_9PLEO|nr:hypothetical protein BDV96DRAFT_37679 [Lophiotrema nucula]